MSSGSLGEGMVHETMALGCGVSGAGRWQA